MSTTLTVHLKCADCDKFLNKVKGKKKMIHNENEANAFARLFQRNIIVNDILCNKCRLSIYSKSKKNSKSEIERDLPPFELTSDDPTYEVQFKSKKSISEVEYVEMHIQRTVATHKYCCICSATKNIIVIPEEARMQSYTKKKIYIPAGNRCRSHLIKNRIYEEELNLLKVHSNTTSLSVLELSKVMETLSIKCDSTLFDKIGDFSLSDKQVKIFTGLTWENLIEIKDMMTSLRNSQSRSVMQALVVVSFQTSYRKFQ